MPHRKLIAGRQSIRVDPWLPVTGERRCFQLQAHFVVVPALI
jgi:hypothetical protein